MRSLHPGDELLNAAGTLAAEIAEAAPVSVALTRQMLWRMLGADHPMAAHRADSRAVYATGAGPDAEEGVMSFSRSVHRASRAGSLRTYRTSSRTGSSRSTSS